MPRMTPGAVVGIPSQTALLRQAEAAGRFVSFARCLCLLVSRKVPAPSDAVHSADE
jgi:hypothetical protein